MYVNIGGQLLRIDRQSAEVRVLVPWDSDTLRERLIVSSTSLTWIAHHRTLSMDWTKRVERMSKGGGSVETLASVDHETNTLLSVDGAVFMDSARGIEPLTSPNAALIEERPYKLAGGLGYVWWIRKNTLVRLPAR